MLFTAIFLILFVAAWLFISMLSWIALSLPRRASGALWAAPFAGLGGIGGGALVPLVGLDNELGIGISMVAALVCATLSCWMAYQSWDAFNLGSRFERWARRNR